VAKRVTAATTSGGVPPGRSSGLRFQRGSSAVSAQAVKVPNQEGVGAPTFHSDKRSPSQNELEIMTMKFRDRMTGLVAAFFLTGAGMAAVATTASASTHQAPNSPTSISASLKAAAAGNYHQIVNKAYDQCVDVNQASTAPSVQLQIVGCNNTGAQAWAPVLISGNTYYLVNQNSGDCIDVRNGSTATFAAVQQFPCNGTGAQQWIRTPVFVNGAIWETLMNANSGLCLDTVSGPGSKLMQYTCGGNDPQLWQVR
jgi:hypothetical protein